MQAYNFEIAGWAFNLNGSGLGLFCVGQGWKNKGNGMNITLRLAFSPKGYHHLLGVA